MPRMKNTSDRPSNPMPQLPWLAGAAIGLAIMSMASGAMAMGAGWALGGGRKGRQADTGA
jgi:hypothetical protein